VGRRKGSRTPSVDVRVAAVALVNSGLAPIRVGERLGVDATTVRKWVANYNRRGMDGLRSESPPGRAPQLSTTALTQLLRQALAEERRASWRPPTLRALARKILPRTGVSYDVDHLTRRIRPLLEGRERTTPASRGLKSNALPTSAAMAPPRDGRKELDDAIRAKDTEAVRQIVAREPSLLRSRNAAGLSPVMVAVYCGAETIAKELVDRSGGDIFEATCLGDVERVEKLLAHDPSLIGAFSPDGWTALHLAAHLGKPEAAQLLLARGAQVDAVARNGIANQPLQAAIAGREPELVRLLIAAGADVNHRSHGGFTASHLAAEIGSREILEQLRAAGADLGAAAEGGKTPLDLARARGHEEAVRWLERNLRPK
jgi:uncharacterized protein